MSRLRLLHITLWGPNVPLSTVEFGAGLTLIRGPSDTGKSFMVEAIDFMLGGKSLKEIPERTSYSTVLLGVQLPTGEVVTISRSVAGGAFSLYRSDLRSGPLPVSDENLAAKHNPKNDKNLSMFLLKHLDLDKALIRKNAQGATVSLSFRDLVHLCIIDETKMQSDVAPAITGQYTTKTKEISTLKLLLEAEDDSSIVAAQDAPTSARTTGAKIEVIDHLLSDLEAQLADAPEEGQLRDQLARLNGAIEDQTSAVEGLLAERAALAEQTREVQQAAQGARRELAEVGALQGRFGLLSEQYDSDLERLATIKEAGVLLGFFTPGACQFCGAEVADQRYNHSHSVDGTAFEDSVDAEIARTNELRSDLALTLEELARRGEETRGSWRNAAVRANALAARLQSLDEDLSPGDTTLRELMAIKSGVEMSLQLYVQIADLNRLKAEIADVTQADVAVVSNGLNLTALSEFSAEIAKRLAAWGYPDSSSVRYDRSAQDIVADDQYRSAHGKGVRAILHAAFTLGLAQYCLDRDIAHPGFVVLDSPLVTYRPPESGSPALLDESLPAGIVRDFYRDIQRSFDGQVIVMENLDPTEPLGPDAVDVVFTKTNGLGRYGFLPPKRSTGGLVVRD
ncbi:AAA family ATPase [Cellulomonas sp. Sa3CUA2]|uniref:AAA family ATPase n=1 Tax=Cellulomonas avistercoris TaxID=2762242 RepID=A0ABR8QHM2_9CELL|nr:ATP-binding protein [Cellulomonas avistercoris]MBD7919904.1 AAA family ATPase [Cellulomonas avistercoris]